MGNGKYEIGIVADLLASVGAACNAIAVIVRLSASVSSSVVIRIMGFSMYHRSLQDLTDRTGLDPVGDHLPGAGRGQISVAAD